MIYVVLPAYNEAPGIESLLSKIRKIMEDNALDYRVVVVNDGSTDGTLEKVNACASKMPLVVLNHRINRGLWETIRDGFEWAAEHCGPDDIVMRLDADDTHDPKYIPSMASKIREGYDVVIASRFQPGGAASGLNAYRTYISRCANILMKLAFPMKGVWEYSCGYRAYRGSALKKAMKVFANNFIELKGNGFTCTVEKLIKFRMIGARFAEVPFVLRYDQKLSASKMVSGATTLGYFILMMQYSLPWSRPRRRWEEKIRMLQETSSLTT